MERKCSWCQRILPWKEQLVGSKLCEDCRMFDLKDRVLPKKAPEIVLPEYDFAEDSILEYRRERMAIFLQRELGKTNLSAEREAIIEAGARLLPRPPILCLTTARMA